MPTVIDGVGALSATGINPTIAVAYYPSPTVDAVAYMWAVHRSGGTITTPTGWELVDVEFNSATAQRLYLFRRVIDGTEGSSVTVAGSPNKEFGAFIFGVDGADTDSPEAVALAWDLAAVGWTTRAGVSVSPTGAALAVSLVATTDDNVMGLDTGLEQGFTLQAGGADYDSISGDDFAFGLATKVVSAGTIVQPTWEQTLSPGNGGSILSFAVAEAESTAPSSDSNRIGGTGAIRRSPFRP